MADVTWYNQASHRGIQVAVAGNLIVFLANVFGPRTLGRLYWWAGGIGISAMWIGTAVYFWGVK